MHELARCEAAETNHWLFLRRD